MNAATGGARNHGGKLKIIARYAAFAAAIALAGCSSSPNTTAAPSAAPSTTPEVPAVTSAAPTASTSYGPQYQQSLKSSLTLPTRWTNGGGWQIKDPTAKVYGLKKAIAVTSMAQGGTAPAQGTPALATITTYDRNGNKIDASKLPSGIAATKLSVPSVSGAYMGGKGYLIMAQFGPAEVAAGSTKQAGWAIHYVVVSDESGKILFDSVYNVDKLDHANNVSSTNLPPIIVDGQSVSFESYPNTFLINPVTGGVETAGPNTADSGWTARIDGVDIFRNKTGAGGLSSASWKTTDTQPNNGNMVTAFGPYLGLNDRESGKDCLRTIDVHTGNPVPVFEKLRGECIRPLPAEQQAPGIYQGVVWSGKDYLRPADGTLVTIDKTDTFQGQFVGGDGIVYGFAEPTPGKKTAAYLDLSEGAAKADAQVGASTPSAVTGDGLAAFQITQGSYASLGYIFVNPKTR